jgi:hypothetical protein
VTDQLQFVRDDEAYERLLLETIRLVAGHERTRQRDGLLDELLEMLVKLNNPPQLVVSQS